MKTITYKLKDLEEKKEKKVTLKLGYVGENEHVQIRIDCSEIWKDYPAAVASLAVEPPEGEKYPAIVTRDGDMVCWTVKDSDLVNDGYGRIQLTFTEGSEIQKTVICRTKVDESIVGSGTAPDPIADFVAEANEALAELEAAEVHGPVIGEDGYWYTWSKDAGEYVKTDTKAQGEDGQQGPAGKDGADGAPGQDGHTPVKGTDYWTQQDQADIVAAAALETVSAVIDDTAGDGDTNKTWSADKIAETTGQLLNHIQGKQDAPETAGTAGQVLGLDANLEPEWKTVSGGGVVDSSLSPSSTNPVENKAISDAINSLYKIVTTTATAESGSYTWVPCVMKKGVKYIIKVSASKPYNSDIEFSTAGSNQVYVTNPVGTLQANSQYVEVVHTPTSKDIAYIRFKVARSDSCVYTIDLCHQESSDALALATHIENNALIPDSASQITSSNYTEFFTDANLAPIGKTYNINSNITSAMIANLPSYGNSGVLATIPSMAGYAHGRIQIFSNSTGNIWFRFESGYDNNYNYTPWNSPTALNKMTCKIFKKVVCCGDSYTSGHINTTGTAVETNEDYAWPHYMETATGNEWVNCGVSGANVITWQSAQRGLLKAQSCGKAQAYIISLGLNDSATGAAHVDIGTSADIGTNAQTYYGGMSKIVRELHTINSAADIFINTIPSNSSQYTDYNQAVRDIVEAYASTYHTHLIDLEAMRLLYLDKSLVDDKINGHYTALGYEQFAEIYAFVLSDYINKHGSSFMNVYSIPYESGT